MLVRPDVEFPVQLGDDEVGLPTLELLGLEHISEHMVAKVEDVLALGTDHLGQDVARSTGIHRALLDGAWNIKFWE